MTVANILNTFISAPIKEKVWCELGPEFGSDAGKSAIIIRTLYGLKSVGIAFHAHLVDCMQHLLSCQSGPVVQRGETIRNWSIILLLHLDLY